MIEFNWKIVIIVLILLVVADKVITVVNLNAIKKNFPKVDPITAEKNPLARFFFQKFGLMWGTILYGIISIFTAFLFLFLLSTFLNGLNVPNALSISLYVFMLFYGFILMNNLYFLLKFSKVIS